MEGNARTWFTPQQKAELWERWRSGQCVADIARALERRNKSGVYRILALNGGNRSDGTPQSSGRAEGRRARRDIAWHRRRSVNAAHRTGPRAIALDPSVER